MTKNKSWKCTCGRHGPYWTTDATAQAQADEHERYCEGNTEVVAINAY